VTLPREITVSQLFQWLADKGRPQPVILDVRRPDEHAYAALAGSILIPLNELEARLDELKDVKDVEAIVVYCHHGIRSMSARMVLANHGFDVTSLKGGLDAWSLEIDPKVPRY
jgi:rhodanese-related sulfurtransferase